MQLGLGLANKNIEELEQLVVESMQLGLELAIKQSEELEQL